MKSRIPFRFLIIPITSVTSLLVGCANVSLEKNAERLVELKDVRTGSLNTMPVIAVSDNKLSVLYSNAKGRVQLLTEKGSKEVDTTARVKKGASYFQLIPQGNSLRALWWSHQEGKSIYTVTYNTKEDQLQQVREVNPEHQVLPPFSVASSEDGKHIGVLYSDERQPSYQTYFNSSEDFGVTWGATDTRIDNPPDKGRASFTSEPQLVKINDQWISFWVDTVPAANGRFRVMMRTSKDSGSTWQEPREVWTADHHVSSLKVMASEETVVVVGDELKRGVFAAVSKTKDLSWSLVRPVEGTTEVSNSGIEGQIQGKYAHFVWNSDAEGQKTTIRAATLDLEKAQWKSVSQRLDIKEVDNTRSEMPVIAATGNGKLVVAWRDYRDIRPNIYIAISQDNGNTWTHPQPASSPGSMSLGWPKLATYSQSEVLLSYEIYPKDQPENGLFVADKIAVSDSVQPSTNLKKYNKPDESGREKRLEQRISSFWDARVQGAFDQTYDFFDFAYRSITPKSLYVANMGVISYLSYSKESAKISGNEAEVTMKVKYEVKPLVLPYTGKPITVTPVEVDVPTKWVWVGDDWYFVYSPSFDPPFLKY